MERIKQKDLEMLVDRINEATDSPMASYRRTNDGTPFPSNIDNYHLDYAYGGVKLSRMVSTGGAIRNISTGGYGTKRELYEWMTAFLAGLSTSKE